MAERKICAAIGCDNRAYSKGFCRNHYHRWSRYGDALGGGTSPGEPRRWLAAHVGWTGDQCLMWPFAMRTGGYGRVHIRGRQQEYAHRIMCSLAHGPPPTPKHEAAHSCGNGPEGCVNPRHLRWDTAKGNAADRAIHGTENCGERNGQAVLTPEDVREIKSCGGLEPQWVTAQRYGVSRQTVSDIRRGKRWAHLS